MTAVRNSRGRFVPANNPLAVIGAMQARLDQERYTRALEDKRARQSTSLRKNGARPYCGPRTRAELAAMAQS